MCYGACLERMRLLELCRALRRLRHALCAFDVWAVNVKVTADIFDYHGKGAWLQRHS